MRLIDVDALKNKKHFTKEQALKIALNTKAPFSSHDTQYIFNTAQIEEMLNLAATAAITNAPTVQREGWVSVPIEPTEEMINAYVNSQSRFNSARNDWALFLSAAPKE